jgi:cytochrome c-type biogenesis protein CcmH/NrfF
MRRLGSWVVALLVLAPVWTGPARGEQGVPNGDAGVKAVALEREARQIETMLIAPCCWREQVSVHQSEAAEQVKQEIRAMLAAGLTRQQVLDRFVSGYGARILAEPPDAGFGRVLHHAPWVLGLSSLVGLAFVITRVTRREARGRPKGEAPGTGTAVTEAASGDAEAAYRQRLDDELRDLD